MGASEIKQPSSEELLAEIATLREQIVALEQEKTELELLMQMTAEHSDRLTDELYSTVETTRQESEEQFEVITNTVPVPLMISRVAEDVIVYANVALGDLTGVASDSLLDRSISEFYSNTGEREQVLAEVEAHGYVNNWELHGKRDDNESFWAAIFIRPLTFNAEPCLLEAYQDLTAYKQAEQERAHLQTEIIEAQQQTLRELSSPIIPLIQAPDGSGGIIVMPLIGSIDSIRARDITRALLAGISQYHAKVVILDITGVPIIDSGVANHLNKTIQAARLKGAHTIVTGISEAVAETIVDLGIDWSELTTLSDLQRGLMTALNSMGIKLTR